MKLFFVLHLKNGPCFSIFVTTSIKIIMKYLIFSGLLLFVLVSPSCKKKGCTDSLAINYSEDATRDDGTCEFEETVALDTPQLIFKFKFDSTQIRLDNFGQPIVGLPVGNSAQSPIFHGISAHYLELSPGSLTQLGNGEVLYQGTETSAGGSTAVDFSNAIVSEDGEVFLSVPLSQINLGSYQWVRVSVTYQNYEVKYKANGFNLVGRLASFVGFNTYISDYVIDNQTVSVNANKLQGYWGFESVGMVYQGQAPGTTVPNPLSSTSPIPPGSCVVTGAFDTPLTISGTETTDITVTLSVSTNNSFEWSDANLNGVYEPLDGDTVVDMGLRGIEAIINQ